FLQSANNALPDDLRSQGFTYQANLITCRTTMIAGLTALVAASAALETGAKFFHGKPNLCEVFAGIINQLTAVWTNRTHEALRDECLHHGGEQERFHIHVEQARNTAHGIVRVECAEN